MGISGVLWPPANCLTSLFCTEDVEDKLVQLFSCYLRKAYLTFYFTNFTCRSMLVSLFLRNCQKDRIPQSFWECKHMYFSFMKCFSFLLSFHFLCFKRRTLRYPLEEERQVWHQTVFNPVKKEMLKICDLAFFISVLYKWLALVMIQFSMYCYLQTLPCIMYFLLCQC